jgi:hypothetical protein
MKRPRYDLTWRAIRRRWAVPKEQSNHINGPMDNHHLKSPSAPLLNSVAFEYQTILTISSKNHFNLEMNEKNKVRIRT